MLIGYNNDVQYRGKTFHIQTEDRGAPAHQIETQIFHSGAILDTRIVSYAEKLEQIPEREARNKSIKQLMQVTHRELYKNLFSGKYDAFAGLEPLEEAGQVVQAEDFNPSQERVPASARILEEQGADAFAIDEGGDHVDIASLKDRLAQMSEVPGGEEEEGDVEGAIKVQGVANLDDIPRLVQSGTGSGRPKDRALAGAGKPILSLSGKHRPISTPKRKGTPSFKETGVSAWDGCLESEQDLSIVSLVEGFLKK